MKKFLWITDPWETLDHPRDTTLRLADEAIRLKHRSYWADVRSIRLEGGKVLVDASRLKAGAEREEASPARVTDFQSIHYRTDPPVDLAYLHPLQLLRLGITGSKSKLVNPAEMLFSGNEKTEAALLGKLMPPCVVASQWEPLRAFASAEKKVVLKPLHEAQSHGIELLEVASPAAEGPLRAGLEKATMNFTRPVLLQRYLPGILQGETRLWFLDGKLLASVRKIPVDGDFRVDMDRGSRVVAVPLRAREKAASQEIGVLLKREKIRLAAVDLIDGLVTDFNFTSPGLIVQMEEILRKNLARPIIEALAR
ncbi:MAG: ATP-grasp domain-containing protein [Bdellovibrionota bacterium]